MLSESQKSQKRTAVRGSKLASFASLSPSASAIEDLWARYPGETPARAIDKALERLRTLEEVIGGLTNVQPK